MGIVNNRICYADHNVVLDEKLYKNWAGGGFKYMKEVGGALQPAGRANRHRQQLQAMSDDGSWTIELPQIDISPMYRSEAEERHPQNYLPEQMLATVYLHNGHQLKVIFISHCNRSQSFRPLWDAMYQRGIKISMAQRRAAEARYIVDYEAIVKCHAARGGV